MREAIVEHFDTLSRSMIGKSILSSDPDNKNILGEKALKRQMLIGENGAVPRSPIEA